MCLRAQRWYEWDQNQLPWNFHKQRRNPQLRTSVNSFLPSSQPVTPKHTPTLCPQGEKSNFTVTVHINPSQEIIQKAQIRKLKGRKKQKMKRDVKKKQNKMLSSALKPSRSFRKPKVKVNPGAKCLSVGIAAGKWGRRENKSVRESTCRRKRMFIILFPAKQTRCQLSNVVVVTMRERFSHASGPSASREFILMLIKDVEFPSLTFGR